MSFLERDLYQVLMSGSTVLFQEADLMRIHPKLTVEVVAGCRAKNPEEVRGKAVRELKRVCTDVVLWYRRRRPAVRHELEDVVGEVVLGALQAIHDSPDITPEELMPLVRRAANTPTQRIEREKLRRVLHLPSDPEYPVDLGSLASAEVQQLLLGESRDVCRVLLDTLRVFKSDTYYPAILRIFSFNRIVIKYGVDLNPPIEREYPADKRYSRAVDKFRTQFLAVGDERVASNPSGHELVHLCCWGIRAKSGKGSTVFVEFVFELRTLLERTIRLSGDVSLPPPTPTS